MASSQTWIRLVVILFGIVTAGMASLSLLQLMTLRSSDESDGRLLPRREVLGEVKEGLRLPVSLRGQWENDPQAKILRVGLVKPEILSWSPRIVLYHNFLSEEECDSIVALAKPKLEGSTVVDVSSGKGVKSTVRTSSGMFLSYNDRKFKFVKAVEDRIAAYSLVPFDNGELLQVLRYEKDQQYHPHHDFFNDEFNLKRGGQRVATMLMYLRTPDEGGETIFPSAGKGECMCGGVRKKGMCVPSIKGDAVLFWSTNLDGTTDLSSLHGSCPTVKGEKWSATKWMRQREFH